MCINSHEADGKTTMIWKFWAAGWDNVSCGPFGQYYQFKKPSFGNINYYSVPHEESELMLGMHDVTSIATIHFT